MSMTARCPTCGVPFVTPTRPSPVPPCPRCEADAYLEDHPCENPSEAGDNCGACQSCRAWAAIRRGVEVAR